MGVMLKLAASGGTESRCSGRSAGLGNLTGMPCLAIRSSVWQNTRLKLLVLMRLSSVGKISRNDGVYPSTPYGEGNAVRRFPAFALGPT